MKLMSNKHLLAAGLFGSMLIPGCETPDPRPVSARYFPPANQYQTVPSAPPREDNRAVAELGTAAPATTPNAMESLPAPEFPPLSSEPTALAAATPAKSDSSRQANFEEVKLPMAAMAPTAAPTPTAVSAPVHPPAAATPPMSVEVKPASKLGHAEDYSWLCGEVHYDHISKGWRLRYAGLDEVDRWGGAVVLAPDRSLEKLKDGQTVRVQGILLTPKNSKNSPSYRVDSVAVVDSSK